MTPSNTVPDLRERLDEGVPGLVGLSALLLARGVLFPALHGLIAVFLAAAGALNPWFAAGQWWTVTGTLANLLTLWILLGLLRREGSTFRTLLREGAGTLPGPLAAAGVILVLAGVTAVSVVLFARAFMAGFQSAVTILISPIPLWGALIGGIGFPISLALVELPFYYGYLMPRLRAGGVPTGAALALCVVFHTAQHVALPFLPAVPYFLYRLLMLAPFALIAASALLWRPRLMLHLMIAQGALNAAAGILLVIRAV